MKKIKAWHFVGANRTLAHTSPPLGVEAGYLYSESGPIEICKSGLHASRTVRDALQFAPGTVLCRVISYGEVYEHADKLVSRHRQVVGVRDVAKDLALWACWCVRHTPIGDGRVVWDLLTDKRSRAAIRITEKYYCGEATREELNATNAAANAAAYAAATNAYTAADYGIAAKFQTDELERRMLALFDAQHGAMLGDRVV